MLGRIFIFIGILSLIEFYFYQALKNLVSERYHKTLLYFQIGWLILLVGTLLLIFFYRPHQWHDVFRIYLAVVAIFEFSKLFGSVFMLLDDVYRWIVFYLKHLYLLPRNKDAGNFLISRSQFLSQLAILFTALPFAGFIYGIIRGAYNFKIHQVRLSFKELPESFDGLKIVQISDLHLGSFFSTRPVQKIVEIVNAEAPDIVVFTGDLVNNIAEEALPYKEILSQLKARLGVYSILGNHDYGDYVVWSSKQEKQNNLMRLINLQRGMGWDVLLNEHRIIERNGEKIAIIGVENWGGNLHFPRYGKLDVAYEGTENVAFKILLSHDPSHWDLEVSKKYPDIQLTLSGHTHGFQFGVEYGKVKFSPVQWVYKHWAGLYKQKTKNLIAGNQQIHHNAENEQYLYVNRGAGFIGYPGRLGIWPEITVIELVFRKRS
ncbi:MAG: phosphoesterase [Bacteroidia bacterium]|nr:MAG: phosphoesterase [Bacteroidia bacterium]